MPAPAQQKPISEEGEGASQSSDSRSRGLIPSPSGVSTGVQQRTRDADFNQQDAEFKQKHAALFEASAAHFTQAQVEFTKALALLPPDIARNFAKDPIRQLAEAPDSIPLLLKSTDVVQGPHSLGSKNYLLGQYATALTELTATIKLLESTQVSLPE